MNKFTPHGGFWVQAFERNRKFREWLNSNRETYEPYEYCTYEFRCNCDFQLVYQEITDGYHEAVTHQYGYPHHLVEGRPQVDPCDPPEKWRRLEERD
jgi:hypothetical protein